MANNWNVRVLSLIVVVVGIIVGFLAFFFGSNSSFWKSEQQLGEVKTTLSFWRNRGTDLENKAYEELVSLFNEQSDTIEVQMYSIPYGDYELKLRTEMAAGNSPDILSIDTPNLALYANAGILLPLDDLMKEDGNLHDYTSATKVGITYNNQIYLAPMAESSVALFYSIPLFKKAGIPLPSSNPREPMTWTEVVGAAKKIAALSEDITGIDPAQGFPDGESPAYFKMPLIWQFGGDILDPTNQTASGYLNSKESLAALQFYQDLYVKHKVAKVEYDAEAFFQHTLGMTVLGSWMLDSMKEEYPAFQLGTDFGVAPLPKATNQVVPNGGWALGISAQTKNEQAAKEFVRFMTSYESAKRYVETTGDIPARYSVAEAFPDLQQYPKNIFVFQAQNYSKNRPVTPAYPAITKAIRVLFEEIGIGGKNINETVAKTITTIDEELQSFQK